MKSQKQQVREWLESGRTLTPLEALNNMGSMRLAAIIEVLRNREGMNITDLNKTGDEKHSNYKLATGTPYSPVKPSKESPIESINTTGLTQADKPCSACGSYYRRGQVCNRCGSVN